MQKITFIGLGKMGYPMAGHLSKAGYEVTVYNRNSSVGKKWAEEYEGNFTEDISQSVKDADIVITCVGDDRDLEEIFLSEESLFEYMKKESILIDQTTASPDIAEELDQKASKCKIDFVDAPVSGGEVGAKKGELTVMVGADDVVFEEVRPILDVYGKAVTLMGGPGKGQLTKLVNQVAHAGAIQAVAEAINFGRRMGLDMKKAREVMLNGAAKTWYLENRGLTMLEDKFDFGFANKHMHKDLQLAIKEANANNIDIPVTTMVDQFYEELLDKGYEEDDFSSLIKLLD
jgi:3-hydroxyisobutyrate dehydrogenase